MSQELLLLTDMMVTAFERAQRGDPRTYIEPALVTRARALIDLEVGRQHRAEPTVTLPARAVRAAVWALGDLVAEFDAEPRDHAGPWYGRNDTSGIAQARQALELIQTNQTRTEDNPFDRRNEEHDERAHYLTEACADCYNPVDDSGMGGYPERSRA